MAVDGAKESDVLARRDLERRPAGAREIVAMLDPLLEAVCQQLGADADPDAFLHGLEAVLATSGPSAALPLKALDFADPMRVELATQAELIGHGITLAARAVHRSRISLERHGAGHLAALQLRSNCDGHSWTPGVIAQLMGPAGGANVMQIYNEWLHLMVVLRDSLLPFENWQDIPLPLHLFGEQGLRSLEGGRGLFLTDLLTKRIAFGSIIRWAQTVMGVAPGGDVYGFQTGGGVVLPVAVYRDVATAPLGLLCWRSGPLPDLPGGATVRFRHTISDYLGEKRTDVRNIGIENIEIGEPSLVPHDRQGQDAALAILVRTGGHDRLIDLGQALRGHRFAYRASGSVEHDTGEQVFIDLSPGAILQQSGLVGAEERLFRILTPENPLTVLAVLGKLFPGNIVLPLPGASLAATVRAGKGFGAKFVIAGFAPETAPLGA